MRLWLFEHPLAHQAIHWLVATWWVRSLFLTTKLRLVSQHRRGPRFCRTLEESVFYLCLWLWQLQRLTVWTVIHIGSINSYGAFPVVLVVKKKNNKKNNKKNPPASEGDARDMCSAPVLGRSPGGGNGNPLQHSCLENPVDRRVWRVIVCGPGS